MVDILKSWTGPAALAPMAGVTDRVFRRICRAYQSGAAYTPMISAKSILYNNLTAFDLMRADAGERPLALQLFGHEAEDISRALARIDRSPYAWVDLNMGCPAPKITRQGEGSALMRDMKNAAALIRAAVSASPLPVSVKFRKGWDEKSANAVDFAKMAQDAGASMLCVHPRYAVQMYAGEADVRVWEQVSRAVSIPLVASGDIKDGQSARRAMDAGCAAVMIGRASYGDPWVFERITAELSGKMLPAPTQVQRLSQAIAHARMLTQDLPEHVAMLQMRKHVAWYVRGAAGAGELRAAINECTHLQTLETLICDFAARTLDVPRETLLFASQCAYERVQKGGALDKA